MLSPEHVLGVEPRGREPGSFLGLGQFGEFRVVKLGEWLAVVGNGSDMTGWKMWRGDWRGTHSNGLSLAISYFNLLILEMMAVPSAIFSSRSERPSVSLSSDLDWRESSWLTLHRWSITPVRMIGQRLRTVS